MQDIYFQVPGKPRPKGRPRFTRAGIAYTPKDTMIYENWVKHCYLQKYANTDAKIPVDKAIRMGIEIAVPIPKGFSRAKRESAALGRIFPAKKPDLDNIAKAVCDALNGLAFEDDRQIVELHAKKRYSPDPCVLVHIETLDDEGGWA